MRANRVVDIGVAGVDRRAVRVRMSAPSAGAASASFKGVIPSSIRLASEVCSSTMARSTPWLLLHLRVLSG